MIGKSVGGFGDNSAGGGTRRPVPEETGRNRGEGGIKKLKQPSVVPGRPIERKIFRFLRSFENERQWGAPKQQNYK
nr:MAG TPA: hypothetical protein [Caudoviricetes sp.]